MKWFFLLEAILLMISFTSGAQELVAINQITLINGPPGGLEFCWTDNGFTYENAELTVLQNPNGVTQTPIDGVLAGSTNCATFENDPALIVNANDLLAFALRLFKSAADTKRAPDAEGFVTMSWPDVIKCQSAHSVSAANTIYRLGCDTEIKNSDHKLFIDNAPLTCSLTSDAASTSINYCFLELPPTNPVEFKICQSTDATVNEDPGDLNICAVPIGITSFSGADSVVTSLQLDYTKKMTASTVTHVLETTTFDIINYWDGNLGNIKYSKVCPTDVTNSLECSAEDYIPGRKAMNILLVGYDSSDPIVIKESGISTIQDLNLKGVFVLDQTIEVRWELPAPSDGIFRAHIENCLGGTGDPSFVDADVLCSATASVCYAYFINIPTGSTSCDTTIDIITAPGEQPKGLNIIKTTVPKTSRRHGNELQIHTIHVDWYQAAAAAQANVCFNYKSNVTDNDFSHYEFVMINPKGQWLKHMLMSQDAADDICFSTFSVNTEMFNVSEGATLVVTQRARDGFTVLAGGEAHIAFNRDS